QFVAGMRRQARIVDPRHQWMSFQVPGQGQGVLAVPRHPQMQRLQPLQEEKAVERAERPAQVAEPMRAARNDVAQLSDRVVKYRAMIGRVWLSELRPLIGLAGPIELAAIDNHAADARSVAADELRGAINRDVDAIIKGPQ